MKEKVVHWLKVELSFPEYVANFVDNGYDRFDAIAAMDKADLKEIGIKAGHIKIIRGAIEEHKAKQLRMEEPGNVQEVVDE